MKENKVEKKIGIIRRLNFKCGEQKRHNFVANV